MPTKVLIVIDRQGATGFGMSFGTPEPNDAYFFSFSHLLNILGAHADITRAHRQTDPATEHGQSNPADIENFRFDNVDLSAYDQIWLIGYNNTRPELNQMSTDVLSEAELAALSTFMNAGGGVYATGDHAGLGLALAGRVPRVRSMRKWWYPTPGPLSEPVAPPPLSADRIDTTQYGFGDPSGGVWFDNQSDDIPQFISPWGGTANLCYAPPLFFQPHPLLQGTHGMINQIADHMHEGEVILPWSLSQMFSFNGGAQFAEYPIGSNGMVTPQIIAWSWTNGVRNVVPPSEAGAHVGDDVPSAPRIFGAIGAYDGFIVDVGRVVVESTWHHFLDINLIGDPIAPTPKNQGFLASADGMEILHGIEQFYINVVNWLSPPPMALIHWSGAMIMASQRHSVAEVLSSVGPNTSLTSIGRIVAGALRPSIRTGMLTSWLQAALPKEVRQVMPALPWGPVTGTPGCGSIDHERMTYAALGGAVMAAYGLSHRKGGVALANDDKAQQEILQGTLKGVSSLAEEFTQRGEGLLKVARALNRSCGRKP